MAKKILLIENEDSVHRMLTASLKDRNYDVILAAKGEDEGIILAITESPDIILIDTDLPIIDSLQVIKILKTSVVTQKIPIIALTATTTGAQWKRVLNSGCNACELKPIDYESLLSKIKVLTEPISIPADTDIAPAANPVLLPTRYSPFQPDHKQLKELYSWMRYDLAKTMSEKSTIVYVDDSPLDSQMMAEIVQGEGYGYNSISEPLKALPMLLEIKPKLIFLDLVMPYTNGYEMCAQIRRASVFKKTPIIIGINNDSIIDRVRAKLVGASGFFSKPVKEDRVVNVLRKYLEPIGLPKGFHQHQLLPFV